MVAVGCGAMMVGFDVAGEVDVTVAVASGVFVEMGGMDAVDGCVVVGVKVKAGCGLAELQALKTKANKVNQISFLIAFLLVAMLSCWSWHRPENEALSSHPRFFVSSNLDCLGRFQSDERRDSARRSPK